MPTPLRFALMGSGRISERHARVLKESGFGRLVGVCDLRPERSEAVGKRFEVPSFDDWRPMVEKTRPDVVTILTPSGLHAENVIELAGKVPSLVVEKPMALRLEDADRMIVACDTNRTRLFVVKQNRCNVAVRKLREAVEANRFGKMVLGTVRVRWCRTQHYYDQDAWRGTWALDGGVLANQASHHIDLLEWMLGEPESVFCRNATRLVDIEADDTAVAVVRFTSGALGIIEATTATRPRDVEGSLSILGERGMVEIGGFAVNEMKTWQFQDAVPGDETIMQTARENPPDVYGFGHSEYLRGVVDAIENDSHALVDGVEGRRSLELISALYESAETGQPVTLRFQPQRCRLGERQ